MFSDALKAKIPIISVHTDDLVNFPVALQLIAGMKVAPFPKQQLAQKHLEPKVYYTTDLDSITVDVYRLLASTEHQLIVVNPDKSSPLVFDAGELPTPPAMVKEYLYEFTDDPAHMEKLLQALKGMSLKTASYIVQLTMVRTGGVDVSDVRHTRILVGGTVQGLYPMDTEIDFYQEPQGLKEWLKLNEKYFNEQVPLKLRPRGLMLSGVPGVGKTLTSKYLASYFKCPLYRLDVATTLNKFIGESENRVARALSVLSQESPCVLLIDEIEKIFGGDEDSGVSKRILSQLLWWLAEHKELVFTVMTTNNLSALPPELYRPGRMDKVLHLEPLNLSEAKLFCSGVFKSVMGYQPTIGQFQKMRDTIDEANKASWSHSEVTMLVYDMIKSHAWYIKVATA